MLATNTHLGLLNGNGDGFSDDDFDELIDDAEKNIYKEDMASIPKAVAGDKTAQAGLEISDDPKVVAAYKAALEAKLKTAKTEKEKVAVLNAITSAAKSGLKFGTAVLSTVNKLSAELSSARGKAGGSTSITTAGGNTSMYIALGVAFVAFMLLTQKKG